MKHEELRSIYQPTPAFHDSVLSVLDGLDEQAPKLYKKRKGVLKIALVCAVIAALGATMIVAAGTNFFGLFRKPVGRYGMNMLIEEEQSSSAAEKKHVKLSPGYIPEGYKPINPYSYYYALDGDWKSDAWTFSFSIADAQDYDETSEYVIDSYEAEFNGHKAIIATHKYDMNSDELSYSATEYFENWGYVVSCYCGNPDELLKIMEGLDLEEDTDYVEPDNEEENNYSERFTEHYIISKADESFKGEVKDGNNTNEFIVKLKSVEKRTDAVGLDYNDFFHVGEGDSYVNLFDRFFDSDKKIITPYTRTETEWGDGVNSLNETKDIVDDRSFYIITIDITSVSGDIENIFDGFSFTGMKYENGEAEYSNLGGNVETIYCKGGNNSLKAGETKTFSYGVVIDDDAVDTTYVSLGMEETVVDDENEIIDHNTNMYCVKLED